MAYINGVSVPMPIPLTIEITQSENIQRAIDILMADNTQHIEIQVIDANNLNFYNNLGIITHTGEYLILETGEYITYA
jgi:hypothetical protein